MDDFIKKIELEFIKHADPEIAAGQKAYMKNRFEFYGIKTPVRREIQKPFLQKQSLPPKNKVVSIIQILWKKPEREYQYFAQELAQKYNRQLEIADINLFEYMITHKSWWHTVDLIATKLVGKYLTVFPERRNKIIVKWISSGNIWLQRTTLLYQLHYKEKLDKEFLAYIINSLSGSEEFFINKAIGWILREYSKTNPDWVTSFTQEAELNSLSRKEALKLIK
jgi:3-methyladenine DNA glycosylase AlkD